MQRCAVRAVPGIGKADAIADESMTTAGLKKLGGENHTTSRVVSSDVSGHLTLRFSADVFPRFSTSSY
jgi:hypothetical protein